MIVYSTYWKIVKKNLPLILLYIGIFTAISWFNIASAADESSTGYVGNQVKVAIINKDVDGKIAQNLSDYISKKNKIVEVEDNDEAMQDALFYRAAEYIIIIPNNFTEDFLAGKDVMIERIQVPDSYSGYYVDNMIDKYLNLVRLYKTGTGYDINRIIEKVEADLEINTNVEMAENAVDDTGAKLAAIVNFTSYVIMAITILFIGLTLGAFNQKNIKRRNNISPVKSRKFSIAQIICNGLLVFCIVGLNILIILILSGEKAMTLNAAIMYLNMFICGAVALSIGFLIANLIKSKNGQTAVANTLSLGFSFISGVFVPLEMLDEGVKLIGSFTPIYWFVRVNNEVAGMTDITVNKLSDVFLWMGIQLLFAIAILIVGIVVSRHKTLGDKE